MEEPVEVTQFTYWFGHVKFAKRADLSVLTTKKKEGRKEGSERGDERRREGGGEGGW